MTHTEATAMRIKNNILRPNFIERFIDENRKETVENSFISLLGIKEFLQTLESKCSVGEVKTIEVVRDPAGVTVFISLVGDKVEEYRVKRSSDKNYRIKEAKKYLLSFGSDIA